MGKIRWIIWCKSQRKRPEKTKAKKCWIVNCNWHVCLLKNINKRFKNINNKAETVMLYIYFHYIHSHNHYFQLLLPKSIYHNVIIPLKNSLQFLSWVTSKNINSTQPNWTAPQLIWWSRRKSKIIYWFWLYLS